MCETRPSPPSWETPFGPGNLSERYQEELAFLRKAFIDLEKRDRALAEQLELQQGRSRDPHVETMLHGFAMLSGRVRCRLDDSLAELTRGVGEVVAPSLVRPMPAAAIMQFQSRRQLQAKIERRARVRITWRSGQATEWSTCQEVDTADIQVQEVWLRSASDFKLDSKAVPHAARALTIDLHTASGTAFQQRQPSRLRFFLGGDAGKRWRLYQALVESCRMAFVADRGGNIQWTGQAEVLPVGFDPSDAMLPDDSVSPPGRRVLREYLTMPERFLFVDVRLPRLAWSGLGADVSIGLLLAASESTDRLGANGLQPGSMLLGCSPIVNLYSEDCAPILIDGTKTAYELSPQILVAKRSSSVWSVDEVRLARPNDEVINVHPLFSVAHSQSLGGRAWWLVRQRIMEQSDVDVISILDSAMDSAMNPDSLGACIIRARVKWTDDLPEWTVHEREERVECTGLQNVDGNVIEVKPSARVARAEQLWRLVSHTSLSYLPLLGRDDAKKAFREWIMLHSSHDSRRAEAIKGVEISRSAIRVGNGPMAFHRGLRLLVDIAEDQGGLRPGESFLFARVLNEAVSDSCSANAFARLELRKGAV